MTTTNYTADDLAPIVGFFHTTEEAEAAGYTFDEFLDLKPGDQVVIYSRNNWRVGLVSHITKTGTVSVQYVTPGGIAEAEKIFAFHQGPEPERRVQGYRDRDGYGYTDEEIDAIAARFAADKARSLLDWVNVTTKTAKNFNVGRKVG